MNTRPKTAQRLAGMPARRGLQLVFALLLTLALCNPAQPPQVAQAAPTGATYYVDWINGSDSNPGTSRTQAWKTIQKAADTMAPGDTTTVLAASPDERVQVSISGAPSAPISYQAESTVVMEGFSINADYINVIGFEITNTPDAWNGWGIYVEGSNCDIERNYIHFATRGGIRIDSGSNDCIIRDNRLYRNATAGILIDGTDNLVEGNEVWGTIQYHPNWKNPPSSVDADGIRFFGNGHIIRKNYIHDILYGVPENIDPHIDCFQSWGPAYNILIEQNTCVNPNTYGANQILEVESINPPVRDLTFRNNIFVMYDPGYSPINFQCKDGQETISNITVENNTIVHKNSIGAFGISFYNIANAIVRNNLFIDYGGKYDPYIRTYGNSYNISISNDAVYKTDGIAPLGGPYPGDVWMKDPKVENLNNLDFHLAFDSPLIDKGYNLAGTVPNDFDGNPRPEGRGYDIGAYESAPVTIHSAWLPFAISK